MSLAPSDKPRFTYADYTRWELDERERFELIHGQPMAMSPAPSDSHQRIAGELYRQLANYFLDHSDCQVRFAPFDVLLPENEEADDLVSTVVQPDIVVVCDPSKLKEKGCVGAPDLVIEIVSPSTGKRDHTVKLELYEKAGVREYWIVQPTEQIILAREALSGQFQAPRVLSADQDPVAPAIFPECRLELARIFPEEQAAGISGDPASP